MIARLGLADLHVFFFFTCGPFKSGGTVAQCGFRFRLFIPGLDIVPQALLQSFQRPIQVSYQ
jgi:hypothetical protein